MSAHFVTATGTDVGKTFVTCAVIAALRGKGRPVDALKPVLSGYEGAEGSDAALLVAALGRPMSDLDRISPWRFRAALAPPSAARAEGTTLDPAALAKLCRERMAQAELLLIEGAGGVMSPIAEGATNLDLITDLGLPVLLVAGSYLGAVSHTLTAIEALRGRGVSITAVVVSESDGDPPPLGEILGALARFAPDIPVTTAPRRHSWDAAGLADRL